MTTTMEGETGQTEEQQPAEQMNTSVDMTIVQEDSMDESHGTEDLQVTLQEAMALRKNLESKFEEEIAPSAPGPSIREKIAHFEKKASENRVASVDTKMPPSTIVTTKDTTVSGDRLKVFLRVRPCLDKDSSTIEILDNSDGKSLPTSIRTYPPQASNAAKTDRSRLKGNDTNGEAHAIKEYEFTSVLGPATSQTEVFEKTAAPLVNGLCQGNTVGKSALLFCYGITNAGKTHTVLGDPRNQDSWGIIPRCLSSAMRKVENTDMQLYLSCFEIYNEQLLDLLPSSSDTQGRRMVSTGVSLKIREGPHGNMVIPGLTEYKVESMEAGLSLIRRAKEGRHTAPNHLNKQSSRSHSICQITVRRQHVTKENLSKTDSSDQKPLQESHLWIVDLAGNERSKRTNAGSLRQKEATYINMSLMNLMRCLTSTQKPFRDSKLTLLFMHHWGNPENQTTMVVNVHGAASDYDETQHVLSYAISSKSIPIVASKFQTANQKQKLPEYDLDGRRKGGKQTMVQKAAKIIRKLSPKRVMPARKRKNHTPIGHESNASGFEEAELPVSKKIRRDQALPKSETTRVHQAGNDLMNQTQAASSREWSSLKMQLSVARAEIQGLETKNRELTQQLEHVETTIRSEVSEEMVEQMKDMQRRYESTIQKLREAHARNEGAPESDDLEKAESKIDELVEKVEECEEEMSRMARMHRAEIEAMQEDHEASLLKKKNAIDDLTNQLLAEKEKDSTSMYSNAYATEVAELKKQLATKDSEIEKLNRSKEELVENYEQLLAGDDDEDDDDGKVAEVARLTKQLSTSRAQVDQLKRSKEELEKNHKRQLAQEKSQVDKLIQEVGNLKTKLADSRSEVEQLYQSKEELSKKYEQLLARAKENVGGDGENAKEGAQPKSPTPMSQKATHIESQLKSTSSSSSSSQLNNYKFEKAATSTRKPFGKLIENEKEENPNDLSPAKFLKPKKSPVKDRKTGLYSRPKGRAPSKADGWDAQRGAWRLSTVG